MRVETRRESAQTLGKVCWGVDFGFFQRVRRTAAAGSTVLVDVEVGRRSGEVIVGCLVYWVDEGRRGRWRAAGRIAVIVAGEVMEDLSDLVLSRRTLWIRASEFFQRRTNVEAAHRTERYQAVHWTGLAMGHST